MQGMSWNKFGILVLGVLLGGPLRAATQTPGYPALPGFSKSDRVLILAPHEDDECLGAGGVIQHALAAGAAVRVLYLTQGDHNEWAFLMYRKSPVLTPAINRQMGEDRRVEALEATRLLGLPSTDVVFLGFPDNGTLKIWDNHWGDSPAFHSLLTNTTDVPYPDTIGRGQPYKGEAILQALESQLIAFRPTRIFVTHPIDSNPDHRAYFLFLQVALLDLRDKFKTTPTVYCYPIHMGPWPRPLNYHPDEWEQVPQILRDTPSPWWMLPLSPDETNRKAAAIRSNKSQMADHGYWLLAFARRNELFTAPPSTDISEQWGAAQTAVAAPGTAAYELGISTGHIASVSYRWQTEGLQIQIQFRHPLQKDGGISIFAFGYRDDVPFEAMPKLHLLWEFGRARLEDQGQRLPAVDIESRSLANGIQFFIPRSVLRSPRIIFAQVRALTGGLPISQTSWRVLEVLKHP